MGTTIYCITDYIHNTQTTQYYLLHAGDGSGFKWWVASISNSGLKDSVLLYTKIMLSVSFIPTLGPSEGKSGWRKLHRARIVIYLAHHIWGREETRGAQADAEYILSFLCLFRDSLIMYNEEGITFNHGQN